MILMKMSKKEVIGSSVKNRGSCNVYVLATDKTISDIKASSFWTTEE